MTVFEGPFQSQIFSICYYFSGGSSSSEPSQVSFQINAGLLYSTLCRYELKICIPYFTLCGVCPIRCRCGKREGKPQRMLLNMLLYFES